jgi:hypothetical protein
MGEVHEIFGGKKLTPEEIEKLEAEKTSIKPISKEGLAEIKKKEEDMAEKSLESLEKSLEELKK